MSVKYRIVYGEYPFYQKKSHFKKLHLGLLTALLCAIGLMLLFYPPVVTMLQELIIPGELEVTANALQQLSEALNTGASFTDALDVFCDAIMDVRY